VTVEEVPGEKADINPSRSKDVPVNEPEAPTRPRTRQPDSAVAPKRRSSTSSTAKKKG
jgi:hypothetical protein